jgi:predicted secreted protein
LAALAGIGASCAEAGVSFNEGSKWTLTPKGATKDVTPFQASGNWAVYLATVKSWTAKITAFIDASDTAQTNLFSLLGSTVALSLNVVVTGTPHGFTGSGIVTGFAPNVDVQNAETIDFDFQGTGPITWF